MNSSLTITAFKWVPPFAQGYVRDLRVRWACKEAGLPYTLRFIDREMQTSESYHLEQPFGQVPVVHDGDLTLFESGAILLHIGEKSEVLMPRDREGRARTQAWMISALNSIEPFVFNLVEVDVFKKNEVWAQLRRPTAVTDLRGRLAKLNTWMANREYLEDRFTAADLMMSTILRVPVVIPIVDEFPALAQYRDRCLARPAFKEALAEQLKNFADHTPKA